MYNCAECGKECFLHRWYSSDDKGNVKATAADSPTYHMTIDNKFIPFCGCQCSNDYYTKNVKDKNYKLEGVKYTTNDV